jgi:hypothetical protein
MKVHEIIREGGGAAGGPRHDDFGGMLDEAPGRGGRRVSPKELVALLRSKSRSDVLRGVKAMDSLKQKTAQKEGDQVIMYGVEGGEAYERAGARGALMDVLEGPLGEWLLEPERAGQTATALWFLDSRYRQKVDAEEKMRQEENEGSLEEEVVLQSAEKVERGVVASSARLDGRGGVADAVEGLGGVRQDADQKAGPASIERGVAEEKAGVLEGMAGLATENGGESKRRADNGVLNNVETGKVETEEGGLSEGLAGFEVGEARETGTNAGNSQSRVGSTHATDRYGIASGGRADRALGSDAMDPVVLRLLRWLIPRRPQLPPKVLVAALVPIFVECTRVEPARVVAARTGALELGKACVVMSLEAEAHGTIANLAWGILDAILRGNSLREEETHDIRKIDEALGLAEFAADYLGTGYDDYSSELHLLNVLEVCTQKHPEGAWKGLRKKDRFLERLVSRFAYVVILLQVSKSEGWESRVKELPDEGPETKEGLAEAGLAKREFTGQQFEIVWDVSESILDDIPDWAHARRAAHQLLTLITDAIAYGGEPAFSIMIRRGLVEAVVAFMETHTRKDILSVLEGLVASGTEGPWEVEAEERLWNAVDLAEGLWEKAAGKYGLHECGDVEVRNF